jgi:LysR family transcriptional regulator, hypochlorite-specific transcription factor HypT
VPERVGGRAICRVIAAMARDGRGMSLVAEDIAAGRLARVGNVAADVPMGIRLFRPKARQSPAAETLWERAVSLVRKG